MGKTIEQLKKYGHTVDEISLPFTMKFGLSAYYIIATCEASTNLSRFCGLRYGVQEKPQNKSFNEFFKNVRSANMSIEEKRRIMLGTFARMSGYRDAYYIKSTKIRTKIIEEYKKIFENYDVIISPTMPGIAPKFSEIDKMKPIEEYMMDIITVGPNLAGIPHASIPVGKKGNMSIGMMASTNHLEDYKLIEFLKVIESLKVVEDLELSD